MTTGTIWEIQQSLNVLAYGAFPPASGGIRDAQQAANDYASTSGLDLIAALNHKAGTTGLDFNAVCNKLNNSVGSGRDGQDALSMLAGGGHS